MNIFIFFIFSKDHAGKLWAELHGRNLNENYETIGKDREKDR